MIYSVNKSLFFRLANLFVNKNVVVNWLGLAFYAIMKCNDRRFKVRKATKIRNQYNQVSHLTQDTTWESDKNTIKHQKQ